MPRTPRICPAGEVFHILNRSVARLILFEKPEDHDAFEQVLRETQQRVQLPIVATVVMPNHWHFVVRPQSDDQVSEFFRRLTVTHTLRWHDHYRTGGTGHLYQGRFKSFPIQDDRHLLTTGGWGRPSGAPRAINCGLPLVDHSLPLRLTSCRHFVTQTS